jgi:hypothetical protein
LSLRFDGTYHDLAGGMREAIDFTVGRQQMADAMDALVMHMQAPISRIEGLTCGIVMGTNYWSFI